MEGNASLTAKRRIAVVCLLVAAVCWGVDTTVSEVALRRMRPGDLLLIELADQRHSVAVLATQVSLPERLVIEALINLLRAGWIEVRSTESGVQFGASIRLVVT